MSKANLENYYPSPDFAFAIFREVRVANSHMLFSAQRFAHDRRHLFGARTAYVYVPQNRSGVKENIVATLLIFQ